MQSCWCSVSCRLRRVPSLARTRVPSPPNVRRRLWASFWACGCRRPVRSIRSPVIWKVLCPHASEGGSVSRLSLISSPCPLLLTLDGLRDMLVHIRSKYGQHLGPNRMDQPRNGATLAKCTCFTHSLRPRRLRVVALSSDLACFCFRRLGGTVAALNDTIMTAGLA